MRIFALYSIACIMDNDFMIRSAKQFATKLTTRIQKTGKLGFGEKERELMKLSSGVYVTFASNDKDVPVTHLIIKRSKDEDSFELKSPNKYPFVEAKQLFDFYRFDYVNKNVYFELTREDVFDEQLNGEVYRVVVRINYKTSNNNDDQSNEEDITD